MDFSTLEEIKRFAYSKTNEVKNPMHDLEHIERVKNNADFIIESLGYKDNIDLNLLYAACYLHDIPVNIPEKYFLGAFGKHFFEKKIIKKYLHNILDKFSLSMHDSSILSETLINHPFSIPYRHLNKEGNLYTKILQDADSIDYFSFQRQNHLKRIKNKSLYYWLLSNISGLYFYLGRKIIRYFLNYPNIAYKYIK